MPKQKALSKTAKTALSKAVHQPAPRHKQGESRVDAKTVCLDFRTAAATPEFNIQEMAYNHADKRAATKSGMKTVLGTESGLNIDRRVRNAKVPIGAKVDDDADVDETLSIAAFDITRAARAFMPRRPAWGYEVSSGRLHHREVQAFKQWLADVREVIQERGGYPPAFEQNLQVWRQLWRTLERCDVALVVLDGRHPLLHLPPALVFHVTRTLKKPLVLVMNKLDAVKPETALKWADVLRTRVPGVSAVVGYSKESLKPGSFGELLVGKEALISECHRALAEAPPPEVKPEPLRKGASVLLQGLVNAAQLNGQTGVLERQDPTSGRWHVELEDGEVKALKPENLVVQVPEGSAEPVPNASGDGRLTIGIVGHPNVGKSSLINSLFGEKVVSVKATPGHTKTLQTIPLDERTCLCDSPGVVFPRLEVPREAQIVGMLIPLAQVREPFSSIRWVMERATTPVHQVLGLKPVSLKRVLELRDDGTDALDLSCVADSDQDVMPWSPMLLCAQWAVQRGLTQQGRPDCHVAGMEIMERVLDGRLPYQVQCDAFESGVAERKSAPGDAGSGSDAESDWGIVDDEYASEAEDKGEKDLFEMFGKERKGPGSGSIMSRRRQGKKLKEAALAGESVTQTARRLNQGVAGDSDGEAVA